jgi:hypothetical protein
MEMGNVAHYIHSAGECLFFRNLLNILGYTCFYFYTHKNVKFGLEVVMRARRGE